LRLLDPPQLARLVVGGLPRWGQKRMVGRQRDSCMSSVWSGRLVKLPLTSFGSRAVGRLAEGKRASFAVPLRTRLISQVGDVARPCQSPPEVAHGSNHCRADRGDPVISIVTPDPNAVSPAPVAADATASAAAAASPPNPDAAAAAAAASMAATAASMAATAPSAAAAVTGKL
jgi:hypothetical protein